LKSYQQGGYSLARSVYICHYPVQNINYLVPNYIAFATLSCANNYSIKNSYVIINYINSTQL